MNESERLPGLIDADWCYECEHEKDDCECLSRTESAAQWFDELGRNPEAGGGERFAQPQRVHSPSPVLQLDYPVWRLSFSEYGEHKGWTLP